MIVLLITFSGREEFVGQYKVLFKRAEMDRPQKRLWRGV